MITYGLTKPLICVIKDPILACTIRTESNQMLSFPSFGEAWENPNRDLHASSPAFCSWCRHHSAQPQVKASIWKVLAIENKLCNKPKVVCSKLKKPMVSAMPHSVERHTFSSKVEVSIWIHNLTLLSYILKIYSVTSWPHFWQKMMPLTHTLFLGLLLIDYHQLTSSLVFQWAIWVVIMRWTSLWVWSQATS